MFSERLGRLVSRRWSFILFAWLMLCVGIHAVAPRWDDVTHDGDFAYLPDVMTSVRGQRILEDNFPGFFSKSQVALVLARKDGPLSGEDFEVGQKLLAAFPPGKSTDDLVADVWSYDTPVIGKKLLSPVTNEGQAALIVLHLRGEFMAIDNMDLLRRIHATLKETADAPDFPPGLTLGISGSAAIGADMLFAAEESILNTERMTIFLVVVILLIVYRAPGLVVVPLVTIGASTLVAMDLVAMATQLSGVFDWFDFKIFKTTRIFVVVILYGSGTDFCLFLISRYKEELARGLDPPQAVAEAVKHVGSALAASALTTIVGLGMMFFADFGKFSNSGPAIAMCLAVTLVACVTVAPALLRGFGRGVFWPFAAASSASGAGGRVWTANLWERLARGILARPGTILVVSLLVLAPLMRPVRVAWENLFGSVEPNAAWRFAVPVNYDLLHELRADRPSVQGTRLLWRYFPADQTGPLTVLARQEGTNFDSKEGRARIARLTSELFDLVYTDSQGRTVRPIESVRSLTEPLGDTPGSFNPLSEAGRHKLAALSHPKTKAAFVSQAPPRAGQITRFDLVTQYAPFSKESVRLLVAVEEHLLAKAADPASPWHGTEFDMVGTASGLRDLEAVTTSDRFRIQILVVMSVLAVLVFILRRPVICVYLILSVLLGYFVTIGTTELVFGWLAGPAYGGLDWKVPLFLFVILIAVGEDYNIYLATRVFEEQRRLGPLEGLRVAVARTGGIITSCGVIMAGTFAAMISGTLGTMQELGFALSLGVLLDTFVIRTILVPAFLAILARRQPQTVPPEAPARNAP
ncbi:MAG: MMPL family transporter [Pirellulales bacterium]|nr:MMPL family transporter [Pirellulales bacterium]